MANEDGGRKKYYNRKSVRPEFAEDVYGGSRGDTNNSGGGGTSTSNVLGNQFAGSNSNSSPASKMEQKLVTESGGMPMNWFDSSFSPFSFNSSNNSKDKQQYAYSRQDPSRFEPFGAGESCSKDDFDHKSLQFVGEMDFQYADCDKFSAELAELYTYSEVDDFLLNFEEFCMYLLRSKYEKTERWIEWSMDSKARLMQDVMQSLESADPIVRLEAARLLLYILQGTYGDYTEMDETDGEDRNGKDEEAATKSDEDTQKDGFFHKLSQRLKKTEARGDDDVLTPPDVEIASGKDRGTGGHEENCLLNAAVNAYFVFESGLFQPLCTMLAIEREESSRKHLAKQQSISSLNSSAGGASLGSGHGQPSTRRSATLADNESLRVVMNCLYHMVEVIRRAELVPQIVEYCTEICQQKPRALFPYCGYTTERLNTLRNNFIAELDEPLDTSKIPLSIFIFDMMPDFVRGKSPHFPIKKMLMLTWKILLATLGGNSVLQEEKAKKRQVANLSSIEDTLEVAATMKPVVYGTETDTDAFISKLSRIGLKNPKVVSMECGKMRFLNRQTACASSGSSEDGPKSTSAEDEDGASKLDGGDLMMNEDDESLNDDAFQPEEEEEVIIGENVSVVNKPEVEPETPNTPKAEVNVDVTGNAAFKYGKGPSLELCATESDKKIAEMVKSKSLERKLEQATTKPPKGTAFSRNYRSSAAASAAGDQTPRAGSPVNEESLATALLRLRALPWRTKVREKDLDAFLQKERQKYFGYQLPNDSTTLFGLPSPVLQSVSAFRRNIYVSLGDLQIQADNEYNKFSFSRVEQIEETKTERLYRRMLPNMTEYVITLLKVILASLPSSKTKSDAVMILSDVLTPENDTNEMLSNSISLDISGKNVLEEAVRFAIDINRHKELIVKASSAIIIMLLKFFRLNHVYQFENFAQYLVLANCLPLVLKFIDQNILRYMQSKHELSPLNYPQCALHYVRNDGEWPVLNADNVYEGDTELVSYYLWRNVFSSINLLRVLNKLTKWKHARTMMLVVFKSAPVLKRCMRIRLGIFQLYVLKLLKMQARFLGRQWRKSNMDIISSIYMKVRHRLNDDWAFANETRSKQWDFQAEEGELGVAVKRFNRRRYKHLLGSAGSGGNGMGCKSELANADGTNPNEQRNSAIASQSSALNRSGGGRVAMLDDDEDVDEEVEENGRPSEENVPGFSSSKAPLDGMDPRDFETFDNCLQSVLSWRPKFSDRFTHNYAKWVDEEVIHGKVNWDYVLASTRGIAFENHF